MKVETHQELRAGMLCIIAFAVGCMLAFCNGCAVANKTQTRAFGEEVEFGGGLFLQESVSEWE